MPRAALNAVLQVNRPDFTEPELGRLADAANTLRVSIRALALRLEGLGKVSTGYYNRISAALGPPKPRQKREGEGGPKQKYVILGRLGQLYADAVLRSTGQGHISKVEASRMLNVAPSYFPQLREVIDARRAAVSGGDSNGGSIGPDAGQ
jgi:Zn-dependent peptidase ImmA (M78 family)